MYNRLHIACLIAFGMVSLQEKMEMFILSSHNFWGTKNKAEN